MDTAANISDSPRTTAQETAASPSHRRKIWQLERIAWIGMGLVLVGAMFGLFGSGPISSHMVGTTDGAMTLSYDRNIHVHSETKLRLTLLRPSISEREGIRLRLNREYLDHVRPLSIIPSPQSQEGDPLGVTYRFLFPAGGPTEITFMFDVIEAGRMNGTFELEEIRPRQKKILYFSQFAYP